MDIKSPTTYEQQIEKLKLRGCIIDNEKLCRDVLSRINYYRLSAYFLPFKNADRETYRSGTTFTKVYSIYEFDRRLRSLLLFATEEIEVYIRAQISYYYAHKYDSLAYEDNSKFNTRHDHEKFLSYIQTEIARNKDVLFVKHHIDNYNGKLPIWVVIELFSFGMLSKFFSDMLLPDQKALAKDMFGYNATVIRSWLQCCTSLRNICAHYGRLYFRDLGAIPVSPKGFQFSFDRKLFSSIIMLKQLYPDKNKWNSSFVSVLAAYIDEYQEHINLNHIGFPENWYEILAEKQQVKL